MLSFANVDLANLEHMAKKTIQTRFSIEVHTYYRDIKLIQITPSLGFRLDDVDFFERERSLVPDV
jgi:hypothetical protein